MADYLYGKGRESFLKGEISWSGDDIRAVLVDGGDYTPVQDTDQYHDAIAGGGIVATSGNFSGKTTALGVADADDVVFSSVSGAECEYFIPYQHTGTSGTSRLIAKIDSYSGLPVTPSGANITFTLPNDANKLFKL